MRPYASSRPRGPPKGRRPSLLPCEVIEPPAASVPLALPAPAPLPAPELGTPLAAIPSAREPSGPEPPPFAPSASAPATIAGAADDHHDHVVHL